MTDNVLEAKLRPPVELWSAAIAAGCALVALIAPWALMMPRALGGLTALLAAAFAIYRSRKAFEVLRYQDGLKHYKLTKIAPHELPGTADDLYLGDGFEWTQLHTQRKVDAAQPSAQPYVVASPRVLRLRGCARRLDVWARIAKGHRTPLRPVALAVARVTGYTAWWNPLKPYQDLGGSPILHGVGFAEKPVMLRQSERNGHMIVWGTTRVGKTRMLELMSTQDIHNGHVVIIIDPKGDADLMMRTHAEAARAGRLDQLYIFHLGYPEISARYNGIANFARITEVATRATNALPSSGNSAAFKEFSWRFTNLVAQAQVALGRVPTYETLLHDVTGIEPLFVDYAKLVLERARSAGRVAQWTDRWAALDEMIATSKRPPIPRGLLDRPSDLSALVLLVKELRLNDPVLDGLSAAVSYERSFYEKIVASLGPFLEKLTTGATGKLISPDYFNPEDKRPIFDWMQVIRQGGIVYVGLDALSDAVVAGAVGNTMLADLVSVGGKLYKTGLDPHHAEGKIVLPTICAHFDEVNEICGPEFVPMVNKLGGSGFRITAYTQSVFDIEARVGDKARAGQILDNFNHVVMLRVKSPTTAKFFTDQVEEVDVNTLGLVTGVTDKASEGDGIDFISNNQDRVTTKPVPKITPSDMLQLPKGQAFALLDGNHLYKLRIPLPDTSNDPFVPESLRAVAADMRSRYRSSEQWAQETDWLASHPIGTAGLGLIATDLAPEDAA